MRVAIVGVGNLGFVVGKRLLSAGIARERLTLVTRGSESSTARCSELGIEPAELSQSSHNDLVILTVKPQDAAGVSRELGQFLDKQAVLLSFMAGVSTCMLTRSSGHESIARAMPNLGAIVGESATAYYVSPSVSSAQAARVDYVISSLGKSWRVESEEMIDLATAVAGSGPAYLCWLGEHIERVAREGGLTEVDAHAIVLQTFKGAVAYLETGAENFSALRKRVTSPQGTTAAALSVLDRAQADRCIREAVTAAFVRAKELGGQDS
jgi:pyrroline-5-carboxylate reductase